MSSSRWIGSTFSAFSNRNYRLFFGGQTLSLVGTWMQRTSVSWVVYTMTHSAFMLGLTIFASQFPSFLFSLVGGVIADRYNRRKLLLFTQTVSMIQAIALAVLTLTHHESVTAIILLSIMLGIINAFDVPARQPLVHELVDDPSLLPNALALNSAMVNLARLAGPALSGFVLSTMGAGACFVINALSFIAVIVSLLLLKLRPYTPPVLPQKPTAQLKEGFIYLSKTPPISISLIMLTCVSFMVLPFDTLFPVLAKETFSGDAATFGYIYTCMGVGAVAGTLLLASLGNKVNWYVLLIIDTLILGVGLICFSHAAYFPLAMVFAAITGFGAQSYTTICITIIQLNADPAMRGRVMSFVAMAFFGMLPTGSLLIGYVSQVVSTPDTILYEGLIALLIALIFFFFIRKQKYL